VGDYGDDDEDEEADDDDADSRGMDTFNPLTESYSAANALSSRLAAAADNEPNPLGEGVNIISEPPFFGSTLYGADGGGHRLPQERASAPETASAREAPFDVRA
jgi:hypothetical protein